MTPLWIRQAARSSVESIAKLGLTVLLRWCAAPLKYGFNE